VQTDQGSFFVNYADYPARLIDGMTEGQVLEKMRDRSANGNTLLRDKPIAIAGHPGREYVIAKTDGNYTVVIRSTLVGHRLYQVVCATPGKIEPTSPDVKRFLDSFALN